MATITGSQNERVFTIKKWLGLHEAPDGDTKLKLGEAAVMRNWRVTRDGNLQKRPGSRCMWTGPSGFVAASWSGILGNKQTVLVVVGGKLYSIYNATTGTWADTNTPIGTVSGGSTKCLMFEFLGKIYIIATGGMYSYDGSTFATVDPYAPVVAKEVTWDMATVNTAEQVNVMTYKRRIWITTDGSHDKYYIPERVYSIDYVKDRSTGLVVDPNDYGIIVNSEPRPVGIDFMTTPAAGTDSYEIGYSIVDPDEFALPSAIVHAQGTELYNGDQLNRVFLYGNGTNKTYYSGINGDTGQTDASYFPELNVIAVGDEDEPITSMIRYNSRLACFKSNSLYSIQYGQMTLADSSVIAAFYVTPVHRELGGHYAQMVMNSPVVVFNGDVYSWAGNDYGNMTADERQAKRISDRVHATLAGMNVTCCFDDNYNQEYYICDYVNKRALVWNYAADAWCYYEGIGILHPFSFGGRTYYFTAGPMNVSDPDPVASVQMLDTEYPRDKISTLDATAIDCYWEGASESFGAEYQRKYSAMLWIGIKPEPFSQVWVTVETDRSASYNEKLVEDSYFSFPFLNFSRLTFNPVKHPRVTRLKIKAKKFAYYKLILKTNTNDSTATVTTADFRVRFTGYVK